MPKINESKHEHYSISKGKNRIEPVLMQSKISRSDS